MGLYSFSQLRERLGSLTLAEQTPETYPKKHSRNRPAKHAPKGNFLDPERPSKMQPHTAWKSMIVHDCTVL